MNRLLQVNDLNVDIAGQQVCDHLCLTINAGQCWALLGRNGTGKTTLIQHLGGLSTTPPGTIHLADNELRTLTPRARAQRIGILLQHSSRGFGASVFETVLSGRHPHLPTFAWEDVEDRTIAARAITQLGLESLMGRSLDTLSGGELRRVELARLLAQQAPLSLLDEPMNHLDLAYQAASLKVLRQNCVNSQRAMLMVLHDLNLAYRACDHWLILLGGGRWRAGKRDALTDPALLSEAYGHPVERIDTENGAVFLPSFDRCDHSEQPAALS